MAAQMNFRTALNGFNRDDVVRYIEYLNAKHIAQVNQLNSELEYLRSKQNETPVEVSAQEAISEEPEVDTTVEQQAARIRELYDENHALKEQVECLTSSVAQKEEQLAAVLAEKNAAVANLEAAMQKQNDAAVRKEEELEAYRRAERTERLARERAEQVYRQTNGVLADATAMVDEAAAQIGELSERVLSQISQLQEAVTGSKQALRDAAETMYAIRPEADAE